MESFIKDYLNTKEVSFAEEIKFSNVPRGQRGDIALSVFEISKKTKDAPNKIIENIKRILEEADFIEKIEIAGPYLNLSLKPKFLLDYAMKSSNRTDVLQGKNIVLEFSGPNTNKPLHLGHMRNHALGIAMSNILEAGGARVHRVNIINDRGIHICKSMLAYKLFGNNETPEQTGEKSDHFVGRYYVRFDQESKKDDTLIKKAQEMLILWEEGDKGIRDLWKKMNEWALSGLQKTYERQGVFFEKAYRESETYQRGKDIAQEGLKKGVFKKREDGAIVIDLSAEKLDEKVILRSDGTSIYLTQDLAVAQIRNQELHPDQMIYIVADEQNYHFQVLFLCLEKLGILEREKLTHLSYGMVNLPEGRMKSREGTVVDADDLMDDLKESAGQEIRKRNPELTENQIQEIAEQIMDGAWKFYLLTTSPRKSITFDSEKSLSFEGASGPYLQYAGVRIKSLLKKATGTINMSKDTEFTEAEKPLAIKILEFSRAIEESIYTKNPTYIATYLLELSQEWSKYYEKNPILNAEKETIKNARILLAKKVLETLTSGLGLLGIKIPERM